MPHIGYKRCRDNKIVKLHITGRHNENRECVEHKNAKNAHYRCSEAYVLDIYDPITKERFPSATSLRNKNFIYTSHQVVKEYGYDSNVNNVCSAGIHYFLSEKAAMGYNSDYGVVSIMSRNKRTSYHDNGEIAEICFIRDGKKDGECMKYTDKGQQYLTATYKQGVFIQQSHYQDGKCTTYTSRNGAIEVSVIN